MPKANAPMPIHNLDISNLVSNGSCQFRQECTEVQRELKSFVCRRLAFQYLDPPDCAGLFVKETSSHLPKALRFQYFLKFG